MATDFLGFTFVNGYRMKFVDSPPDSFYCHLCSRILREPRIAECCGKTCCEACVGPLIQRKDACPFCKAPSLRAIVNRHVKNRIDESEVYCPGKEKGCATIEKLEVIVKHINTCEFVEIACPYNCGAHFTRNDLYSHLQTCKRFPLLCNCGKEIERSSKDVHNRTCPLTKVKCPFNIVGCTVEVLNKNLIKHYDDALDSHMDLVSKQSKVVDDAVKQTKENMHSSLTEKVKMANNEIASLLRDATETDEKIKSLSKLLTDLEGEILYISAEEKTSKEAFEADIAAKELRANGLVQQVNNLHLQLKVKKLGPAVPRYPAYPVVPRPTQPMGSQIFIAPITFQIPNFAERVANDELWYSPPFFTHRGGYKFCLKVYCNGNTRGHSKWLSVFAQMIKGENDNKLHWPFSGTITIKIPNKLKNTHHQIKTIHFDNTTDPECSTRKRIISGYFAKNDMGYWNFMTKSVLFPNSLTLFPEFKYIVDDKLEITVGNVNVF